MKTAVNRVERGKQRQINMRVLAMTDHYVDEPGCCNPAAEWEKRRTLPQAVAGDPHGKQPGTIASVWAGEQAELMSLPLAFDGFNEVSKRASPTCLICCERSRYNVPPSFANRTVSLRICPDRLVVAAGGNILCEHPRVIERSHMLRPRTTYDWRHSLAPRHCPRPNGGQWINAEKARRASEWCALSGVTVRR